MIYFNKYKPDFVVPKLVDDFKQDRVVVLRPTDVKVDYITG